MLDTSRVTYYRRYTRKDDERALYMVDFKALHWLRGTRGGNGALVKTMYPLYVSKLLGGLLLDKLPDVRAVYPDKVHTFWEVGDINLYLLGVVFVSV